MPPDPTRQDLRRRANGQKDARGLGLRRARGGRGPGDRRGPVRRDRHHFGRASSGILVAFDADGAGRRAAVGAYHLLSPLADRVQAVMLPSGQDPAQILHDCGPSALAAPLASDCCPLADLVVDAKVDAWSRWLSFDEGQIGALRAAATVVAAMPPAEVGCQVGRLAERLGLDFAIATEAVTDALSEMYSGSGRRFGRLPTAVPALSARLI